MNTESKELAAIIAALDVHDAEWAHRHISKRPGVPLRLREAINRARKVLMDEQQKLSAEDVELDAYQKWLLHHIRLTGRHLRHDTDMLAAWSGRAVAAGLTVPQIRDAQADKNPPPVGYVPPRR